MFKRFWDQLRGMGAAPGPDMRSDAAGEITDWPPEIPTEALLAPRDAIESMIACAAFWPRDPRAFLSLLPPWPDHPIRLFPPIREADTDIPYGWSARPDDWTTYLNIAPHDAETEALPSSGWNWHLRRLGPVALAEAQGWLAARHGSLADGQSVTASDALKTLHEGRGLVWYHDLVGFDQDTTVLPQGGGVLQHITLNGVLGATSTEDAARQLMPHLEQHFRLITTRAQDDRLELTCLHPLASRQDDALRFIVTLTPENGPIGTPPLVTLGITAQTRRSLGDLAD